MFARLRLHVSTTLVIVAFSLLNICIKSYFSTVLVISLSILERHTLLNNNLKKINYESLKCATVPIIFLHQQSIFKSNATASRDMKQVKHLQPPHVLPSRAVRRDWQTVSAAQYRAADARYGSWDLDNYSAVRCVANSGRHHKALSSLFSGSKTLLFWGSLHVIWGPQTIKMTHNVTQRFKK
jgi:hypothetical protein